MRIDPTLRGFTAAFFRHRRAFKTVFLPIVGIGLLYVLFAPSKYQADGSLLVKFGRDATPEIARTDGAAAPEVITQNDRRETITSDVEILESHALLHDIVAQIGPEKLYPGIGSHIRSGDSAQEAAIRRLSRGDLIVKSDPQSNLIKVWAINRNPQMSALFVHDLFKQFIQRQSEMFNKPQTDLLKNEVNEAGAKLAQSQAALEEFKQENNISSIDTELAELLRQRSDASTLGLDTDTDAWNRLADMQAKESQLLATYLPSSPVVMRQHQNVVLAQRQLEQLQGEQNARIGGAIHGINHRIADLESQRSHYRDLMRQVEIDEENYKNYQLRSENARINDLLNRNSITPIVVVDEPTVPVKPFQPRRLLVLVMSLLAGCVCGTGTVLVLETLDSRFTSPQQVRDTLGVPVMASFV